MKKKSNNNDNDNDNNNNNNKDLHTAEQNKDTMNNSETDCIVLRPTIIYKLRK